MTIKCPPDKSEMDRKPKLMDRLREALSATATGSDQDKLSLHKEITFKGVTFLSLNTYF
ncbi:hypothetical protein KsCSTR_36310 [Candidatus Kuenenia stuttgartiensis]|jgi:hypothetical protein|uniref:Uncharacterized protein n=1 Tax=Kuenenia stuttgartiensis TaxID=174633 RepID=A0A6G7GTS0_KUEST|nr:hypothetical protein [Candidatus Kuenenia stuttgartiensis]QII13010.1 hypothetical protein KsCSTR_36310 [Candidatus Kuenenia stuttgartiensis]